MATFFYNGESLMASDAGSKGIIFFKGFVIVAGTSELSLFNK